MTGFKSKKNMAEDKLFGDALTIAYQSGYYDGKQAEQPAQEPVAWCSQCGHKCPLPAQEPVAWMHVQGNYEEPSFRQLADDEVERGWKQYPLYTAPPQRPWVELTNKEIEECNQFTSNNTTCIYLYKDDFEENGINFARAVIAKSKEKNT